MSGDRCGKRIRTLYSEFLAFCRTSLTGLAAVLLSVSPTAAQQGLSVREALPGCHAAIDDHATVADRIGTASRCNGIIEALISLGQLLPDHLQFCVPGTVRLHEVVRLITDDLEKQYALIEDRSFTISAVAVLHARWPCKGQKQ